MSQTFKAILIDPFRKAVEAVTLTEADTKDFLAYLYRTLQVQMVGGSGLPNGDFAYYDDESLLVDWDQQAFFQSPFFDYPLAGRWLIVRTHAQGDEDVFEDCRYTVPDLFTRITWVEPKDVVVPAPVFVEYDKHGNVSSTKPVYGSATWSYTNQP